MASSSSAVINLGSPPSDKLTRTNYPVWRSQVLPPIRGAQLVGFLDGTDVAPEKLLVIEPADAATSKPAKTTPNPATLPGCPRTKLSWPTCSIPSHPGRFFRTCIGSNMLLVYGAPSKRCLLLKARLGSRTCSSPSPTPKDTNSTAHRTTSPGCKVLPMNSLRWTYSP